MTIKPGGDADWGTLFLWLSPNFPVGGFAFSHGLEWAVEKGDVHDEATTRDWLLAVIHHGAVYNDALLCAASHRAILAGNEMELRRVNALALALNPSSERYLESVAQGNAFMRAMADVWPHPALAPAQACENIAYAVAVGAASAAHQVTLTDALYGFILAFCTMIISASLRLGTIGQTSGQMILRDVVAPCRDLATRAAAANLDDLGSAAFYVDLCSLSHATQYSRIFRS